MPPDVAQKVDVVELGEPIGVVGHDGVVLAVAEADEMREGLADAGLVGLDLFNRQKLAALVLARRIADHRRAAAHQRDRLAARLLEPVQHHDLHERADVQRGRRAIKADVARERPRTRLVVQPLKIGALMNETALLHHAQEVGSGSERVGHMLISTSRREWRDRALGGPSWKRNYRNGTCARAVLAKVALQAFLRRPLYAPSSPNVKFKLAQYRPSLWLRRHVRVSREFRKGA